MNNNLNNSETNGQINNSQMIDNNQVNNSLVNNSLLVDNNQINNSSANNSPVMNNNQVNSNPMNNGQINNGTFSSNQTTNNVIPQKKKKYWLIPVLIFVTMVLINVIETILSLALDLNSGPLIIFLKIIYFICMLGFWPGLIVAIVLGSKQKKQIK